MANLTKAHKNLQQVQKDAAEIRDEMLEEMAMYQINHNNTDIATIIKNICHREEIKTSVCLMKPIAKGEIGGTVSYIKESIPIESPLVYPTILPCLGFKPVCKDIYDNDEVMSKLLHHNKLHLNQ
eukprot:10231143-Ditylum_brightwellii.AAC.1